MRRKSLIHSHYIGLFAIATLLTLGVCGSTIYAQQPAIQQSHQTRLALVIGNSKYTDLPKLKNPANDAGAIVDVLRGLGFDVTLVTDASELNIRRAVRKFADQSEQADLALVYYAGHGAQVNGENYLLPVDMEIPHTEADIELSSLKVDDLVNSIRSTTKIVFLDACRDNPALFKNLIKGRGAVATGLAPTDASHLTRIKPGGGVFIAYATDTGSVALEGEGEHSPFTQALLRNLKKSISIDDMFSLVTKEVSLVTKGMQRPYKYASLTDIVCLTGSCSSVATAPTTDIVQEVRRSEAGELQIALQTNNPVALETYLEKYPQSPQRERVLGEIGRLKRSEFNEWTHFQISNGRFPQYLKVSSINQFGDRVAVQVRGAVDPTTAIIGSNKFPEGNFYESTAVVDCKQPVIAMAESRVVTPSGELLAHYKVADPQFMNLSRGGFVVAPGQVGEVLRKIVCDETLRTPLVTKQQLSEMNFSDLASTPTGDGEIYYQAMQNDKAPVTEKDVVVIKLDRFAKVTDMLEPSFSGDLGTYNFDVDRVHFKCNEQKNIVSKSEYYDSAHNLIALVIRNPPAEVPFKGGSPLATLQRILCESHEVQK